MKKVCFITDGLAVGGAEKFFITVVNKLKSLQIEPLVILLNDDNPLIDELGKDIKYIIIKKGFVEVEKLIKRLHNTYIKIHNILIKA